MGGHLDPDMPCDKLGIKDGKLVKKYYSPGPQDIVKNDSGMSLSQGMHNPSAHMGEITSKETLFKLVQVIAQFSEMGSNPLHRGSFHKSQSCDVRKMVGNMARREKAFSHADQERGVARGISRDAPFTPSTVISMARSLKNTDLLELALLDLLVRPNAWRQEDRRSMSTLLHTVDTLHGQDQYESAFNGPPLPRHYVYLKTQ